MILSLRELFFHEVCFVSDLIFGIEPLTRLPTGQNTVFNSEIFEMRKCLFEKVTPTIFGGLSESTRKCAMFLDILQTENGDKQLNWYPKPFLCMSKLDTWKAVRLEALVNIFKNETISFTRIMQLLEFTISQMLEVLFQKNIPLACSIFDWMLVTMKSAPIGLDGETIDRWIAWNGGWRGVIKSALKKNAKSKPEGPVHCKSCKRVLFAPFGFLKEQCRCGQWVCLKESCYVSYALENLLTQHISHCHIKNAKLNECLHCGNVKDRSLAKCPVCGALWCIREDCRYETRKIKSMIVHEGLCGKNKRKIQDEEDLQPEASTKIAPKLNFSSQTPQANEEQSVTEHMSTKTSEQYSEEPKNASSSFVVCGACKHQIEASLGTIKQKCTCNKWVCLKKNCGFISSYSSNLNTHQWNNHFYNSNPNECSHCGNFKDRQLGKCPKCKALWCTKGQCNFETRLEYVIVSHRRICNGENGTCPRDQKKVIPITCHSNCGNCGMPLSARIGKIRIHCACGKWVCMKKGCLYWGNNANALRSHIESTHFNDSKIDECVHCENHKDRAQTQCPICQAYWCTRGECRYETLQLKRLRDHQENCRAHLLYQSQ